MPLRVFGMIRGRYGAVSGMKKNKPLLRAQFYHDEARKLRDLAAREEKEHRGKILLQIAESYDEICRQLLEGSKAKTG